MLSPPMTQRYVASGAVQVTQNSCADAAVAKAQSTTAKVTAPFRMRTDLPLNGGSWALDRAAGTMRRLARGVKGNGGLRERAGSRGLQSLPPASIRGSAGGDVAEWLKAAVC